MFAKILPRGIKGCRTFSKRRFIALILCFTLFPMNFFAATFNFESEISDLDRGFTQYVDYYADLSHLTISDLADWFSTVETYEWFQLIESDFTMLREDSFARVDSAELQVVYQNATISDCGTFIVSNVSRRGTYDGIMMQPLLNTGSFDEESAMHAINPNTGILTLAMRVRISGVYAYYQTSAIWDTNRIAIVQGVPNTRFVASWVQPGSTVSTSSQHNSGGNNTPATRAWAEFDARVSKGLSSLVLGFRVYSNGASDTYGAGVLFV